MIRLNAVGLRVQEARAHMGWWRTGRKRARTLPTSPCNHVYVLNGENTRVPALERRDISREQGRRAREGAGLRKGVVWSNRLGKLTKSRQLSERSWVTDFDAHTSPLCVCVCAYSSRNHPLSHPADGAMPPRRAFKRAHFAHPALLPLHPLARAESPH